jgi:preprotein translocase subunit SecG
MATVIIVIHLMVVLAMIGLVLLQRSEGGALGIGGGGGAFMTGRGAGNVLTRATGVLAAVFFATSIGLALLTKLETRPSDILERLPGQAAPADVQTPAPPVSGEVPSTADELIRQLGGTSGPQTPPTEGAPAVVPEAPAAETPPAGGVAPATPAPVQSAPAPQQPAGDTGPQTPATPAQ